MRLAFDLSNDRKLKLSGAGSPIKLRPMGLRGADGAPGASFVPQGSVPTSGDLPASGEVGDGWVADDTGHLWVWTLADEAWVDVGPFRGEQGEQGDDGAPGPPNALTKGTVTEGEEPDFTITGDAPDQVLNLVLPRGAPGAASTVPGPPGDFLAHFEVDWNNATTFTAGSIVRHDGSSWIALTDNINVAPIDGATWKWIARKGDNGAAGDQGEPGDPGPPGPGSFLPNSRRITGPLTSAADTPVITTSAAANPAYNKAYTVASNAFPAAWPIDMGNTPDLFSGNFNFPERLSSAARRLRFVMDGDKFALYTQIGAIGDSFLVFVNGSPVSLAPTAFGAGNSITTFAFPAVGIRTIEILTTVGINGIYTHNPYRLWKPDPLAGLRVLFVGDSYTAGTTLNTSSSSAEAPRLHGWSAQIGFHIGIEDWIVDGIGGSGYIAGTIDYLDRLSEHIALAPDVAVISGGGANDLFTGQTTAAIIAAATDYFTDLRAGLPDAKLVFVEGFAPPNGFSTFNDEYIAIRTALQTDLAAIGVYYIDVATTAPWIDGTGRIGATTGTGNSDVYVGGDGIHLSIAGQAYVRERMAAKLRRILADDGTLLNTLI